mgnify:CR=1 FL=1
MDEKFYIIIGVFLLLVVCLLFVVLLWKYVRIKKKYNPVIDAEI